MVSRNAKIVIIVAVAAVAVAAVVLVTYDFGGKKDTDYTTASVEFTDLLREGDFDGCVGHFDVTMKASLPPAKLKAVWNETVATYGPVRSIQNIELFPYKEYIIAFVYCRCDISGLIIQQTYDKGGRVAGLFFKPYDQDAPASLPDKLEENGVNINEGTEWELNGKIVRTKGAKSGVAAVLVQGSGPSDMDETISVNKPFRDIAWGLAENGVDSVRYDKRTYTHGGKMASMDDLTVEQETIEDAIAAAKLLRTEGYSKVYLVGHSLGGMIAPRIVDEGKGVFDGMVIMAGSPRKLTDIIKDQNDALIASMPESADKEALRQIISTEYGKVANLDTWTDAELKSNKIFELSAYYLKDLAGVDAVATAKKLGVPTFIIQGSADFQVYADKDYKMWQTELQGETFAKFKLYAGLNHLFMLSQGQYAGTVAEYGIKSSVSQQVVDDMAGFMKN